MLIPLSHTKIIDHYQASVFILVGYISCISNSKLTKILHPNETYARQIMKIYSAKNFGWPRRIKTHGIEKLTHDKFPNKNATFQILHNIYGKRKPCSNVTLYLKFKFVQCLLSGTNMCPHGPWNLSYFASGNVIVHDEKNIGPILRKNIDSTNQNINWKIKKVSSL